MSGEIKREVFDLIIPMGKGRKRAELIRARLEVALREMLAPTPIGKPRSEN